MTTATMSPETAVTGLTYRDCDHVVDGASSRIIWADWVNRKTATIAGSTKDGYWGVRIEAINQHLRLTDFDRICDTTGGERIQTEDFTGRGGQLTAAGVVAAVELAMTRAAAPPKVCPPGPETFECLECGAVYPAAQAHLIETGGMGCARCNQRAPKHTYSAE